MLNLKKKKLRRVLQGPMLHLYLASQFPYLIPNSQNFQKVECYKINLDDWFPKFFIVCEAGIGKEISFPKLAWILNLA